MAAAAVAALALAGCGSSSSKSNTSSGSTSSPSGSHAGSKVKAGVVFDIGGRGDKSFNDAAYAGAEKARRELGITYKALEPNTGGTNRQELLKLLADQGYNPIFAIGFSFDAAMNAIAPQYPKTTFAIVDDVVNKPNVASLIFSAEQSSYLVGAAAALKSTGGKVGFIGGVNVPLIQTFQAGFDAGAKKAKPGIQIVDKYLTQPPDLSGFTSPDKGKEAANGMYDQGVDVVYAAAGSSGTGVFQAAAAKNKLAIGVDSDQYLSADPAVQHVIITSALKRVDTAVFDVLKDFVAGKKVNGTLTFDLKNDGVGISYTGGKIDDIKPQLEALRQQIIAGTIMVPTKL
jgi:basic membrane protein A and related proteins